MTATAARMTVLAPLPSEDANVVVVLMITPGQATDLFLGDITRRGYSERTVETYKRILYKFCDRLPVDYHVGQITTDDCRRFLDSWNRSAAGTRAHTFSVVSSFMDWLVVNEKIKRSPLATLARPRRRRPADLDVTTISQDGVRKLLEAAETWTEKLAVAIPAYLGPRRRAIAQLKLADYDTELGRMRFMEKGGKVIWKPVPHELAALLGRAIADGAITETDDYLVPPEGLLQRGGTRDDRVIWRVVKRVANRAGVSATVHALRAAFACHYLETNPGDTYGLKELLGHTSLETTQVYLRYMDRGAAMEPVRALSWLTTVPPLDEDSWVYFIAAGDFMVDGTPVKIGVTGDIQGRLQDLQSAHHSELTVVALVPGGIGLETHLHAMLADERIRGEWFASSRALRGAIVSFESTAQLGLDAKLLAEASRVMGAGGFEPPSAEPPLRDRPGSERERP